MRFFLTVLLLLVAAPARADWVKMGETEKTIFYVMSGAIEYYIDPTSIERNGNLSKVWEIHDLPEKGPSGERSVLASVEYDCAEKRMRTLSATGHSVSMASGEIIQLRGVFDDWIYLKPGKEDRVFFKIIDRVCTP